MGYPANTHRVIYVGEGSGLGLGASSLPSAVHDGAIELTIAGGDVLCCPPALLCVTPLKYNPRGAARSQVESAAPRA